MKEEGESLEKRIKFIYVSELLVLLLLSRQAYDELMQPLLSCFYNPISYT